MFIGKFLPFTLLIAFIFPFTTTSVHAAPAKKITASQAKIMYNKAVFSSKAWINVTPMQISKTLSSGSKVLAQQTVIRDSKGVVKAEDVGSKKGVAYYDGDWVYASGSKEPIGSFELEIANKLGLNSSAEFRRFNTKSITSYNIDFGGSAVLGLEPIDGDFGFHFINNKPSCYLSEKSKEKLLSCRYFVESKDNVKKKANEITYTIVSGRFTKVVEVFYNGNKETTTYNTYKDLITLPVGPFLDYDAVLNNFEYKYTKDLKDVKFESSRIISHLKLVATTAGRALPNLDDWKLIAKEYDLLMYDKGVGYTVRLGLPERVKVCIVFTEEGGRLELVSCESLGFVHPY